MSKTSKVESTGFKTELQKTADQFEVLMTPAEEAEEQQEDQIEEVVEEVVEEAEEEETEELSEATAEDETEEEIEESEEVEVEKDEQEALEEEEQPKLYTVKIDGVEQQVTLDELQQGYSRQQDYTRKTQELSGQRKDFETQQSELAKKDAIYKELLPKMQKSLEGELANEPDWKSIYESDPIAYVREKDLWNEKKRSLRLFRVNNNGYIKNNSKNIKSKLKKLLKMEIKNFLRLFLNGRMKMLLLKRNKALQSLQ